MEGQGNPFEESQRLAKSRLAIKFKAILEQPESAAERIRNTRRLAEKAIENIPESPLDKKLDGLAESVLARQVLDLLSPEELDKNEEELEELLEETSQLAEYLTKLEKIAGEARKLVERFIVK